MKLAEYPSTVVTIYFNHGSVTGSQIVEAIEKLASDRNAALNPNQYHEPSAHRVDVWKETFYHDGELVRIGQCAGSERETEQLIVLPSLDGDQRFWLRETYDRLLVVTHLWQDPRYTTRKSHEFREATIDFAKRLALELNGRLA